MAGNPEWRLPGLIAPVRVSLLVTAIELRRERTVHGRNAEVRGALKHVKMFRLRRDNRDHLDPGGSRTDDADAAAREIDTVLWPQAAVIPVAPEGLQPRQVRHAWQGEIARCHDAERRFEDLPACGLDSPEASLFIKDCRYNARIRLDKRAKLEPVRHVIDIAQDIGLCSERAVVSAALSGPIAGGGTINSVIHYHYPTADDMAQILSLNNFRDFGGGSVYDAAFGFLDQNPHNTMHIWTGGMNPRSIRPPASAAELCVRRGAIAATSLRRCRAS